MSGKWVGEIKLSLWPPVTSSSFPSPGLCTLGTPLLSSPPREFIHRAWMNTNHTSDSFAIGAVAEKHNYQISRTQQALKVSCTKSCLFPISLLPFQPFIQTFCLYTPREVKYPLKHRWFLQPVVGEKGRKSKKPSRNADCPWLASAVGKSTACVQPSYPGQVKATAEPRDIV